MIRSSLNVEQTASILEALSRENTDALITEVLIFERQRTGALVANVKFKLDDLDVWQELRFTRSATKIGWVVECASCGDEQVFDDPIVAREYQEENGIGHCALESCRNEFIRTEKAFAKEDEAWRNET